MFLSPKVSGFNRAQEFRAWVHLGVQCDLGQAKFQAGKGSFYRDIL